MAWIMYYHVLIVKEFNNPNMLFERRIASYNEYHHVGDLVLIFKRDIVIGYDVYLSKDAICIYVKYYLMILNMVVTDFDH